MINLFLIPVLDRKIGPVRTNQIGSVIVAVVSYLVYHKMMTQVINSSAQSYFVTPAVNLFVKSPVMLWIVLLFTMATRTFGNTLVFTSTFVMVHDTMRWTGSLSNVSIRLPTL